MALKRPFFEVSKSILIILKTLGDNTFTSIWNDDIKFLQKLT
jgi:hypothetical protein